MGPNSWASGLHRSAPRILSTLPIWLAAQRDPSFLDSRGFLNLTVAPLNTQIERLTDPPPDRLIF